MADLAAFTTLLDSTLSAPRLSGTKVQSLTSLSAELTAKNLDTDLITSFYRANNALPPAGQGRISSLYVFDAIARAARSGANKEKEKGKAREGRGMTGLITKMEGVADSWVGGMVDDASGAPWIEGRDKMRKVLDIWVKGATFPPATLERLRQKVSPSAPPSVRSPGYGSSAYAGISTTPPGTPPKAASFGQATFGTNDGYANLGHVGGIVGGENGQMPSDGRAASASTSAPAPAALPVDILKLLGAANCGQSGSGPSTAQTAQTQSPTPAPGAALDIASILAAVRPGSQAVPDATTSSVQADATPNAANSAPGAGPRAPLAATILGALNLDSQQMAALSALTAPQNGGAIPTPNGHAGQNGQPPFSSAMPYNGFGQSGPGYNGGSNDPRLQGAPGAGPSSQAGPMMGSGPDFGRGGPPFPPGVHMGNMGDTGRQGAYDNRDNRAGFNNSDSSRGWDAQHDRAGQHGRRDGHDGARSKGPGRRDDGGWDRGRDSRGPSNDRNNNASGGWNGPRPRSRSPPNRNGNERNGFGMNGGREGRGSRDFDHDGGWGGARPGGGPGRQGSGPDRQPDDRWRDNRRDAPNDRTHGGQRDQGYGNLGQNGGQGAPPPPSPQRGAGRGGTGRAPLPEGRDMHLDTGRPGGAESASNAGSVGQGTPAAKGDNTPLSHGLNRTPQQGQAGLPPVHSLAPADARQSHMPNQMPNGGPPGPSFDNQPNNGAVGDRLETFNIATFNPMLPDCWSALGRAFKNTTGREPNQMELMGFLAGQGPVPLPGTGGGAGSNGGMGMGMNTMGAQSNGAGFGGPGGAGGHGSQMGTGPGNGMGMGGGMANGPGNGMPMGDMSGMGGAGHMGGMSGMGGPGTYGSGAMDQNQRMGQY